MTDEIILAFMTPAGDFALSCLDGTALPRADLLPAPVGGAYGRRWTGADWVDDPCAYDRAIAFCYPNSAPAPDSCTALQGRRALGMERVQHIDDLVAHLDILRPDLSAEEIWVVQMAWLHAATWERLGHEVNLLRDLYGMTEAERDQFMRLAVTL